MGVVSDVVGGVFGSKTPAPTTYSPAQVAAADKETAIVQAQLNRVNQINPFGSVTYTSVPGAGGAPTYTQTQSYSPEMLALVQAQMGGAYQAAYGAQTALGAYGNAAMDANSIGRMAAQQMLAQGQVGAASASNVGDWINQVRLNPDYSNVEAAKQDFFKQGSELINSQYDTARQKISQNLFNQGISQDSDSYRKALSDFETQRNQAFNQLASEAIQQADSRKMLADQRAQAEAGFEINRLQSAQQMAAFGRNELLNALQGSYAVSSGQQAALGNMATSLAGLSQGQITPSSYQGYQPVRMSTGAENTAASTGTYNSATAANTAAWDNMFGFYKAVK
jgi:hypothetical protein